MDSRRYWWVNQNQTYQHEQRGGYLWSPKRKANNTQNPFYDFMREIAPGDIIFCFYKTRIPAIGIAQSHAYESPKPLEFGSTGAYWDQIGWRIDASFQALNCTIRPADHLEIIGPHLMKRYAPLRSNGSGKQAIYLTNISSGLAAALADLIGREAHDILNASKSIEYLSFGPGQGLVLWEEHEIYQIHQNLEITETDRQALVTARRGQGIFKKKVMQYEKRCRITKVSKEEHLRASHTKPWRSANNQERLDGENGLLLTPSIDHLFDRGFISFDDSGLLLISPVADLPSLKKMGIPQRAVGVGTFTTGQQRYLDHHRQHVFLQSSYMNSL